MMSYDTRVISPNFDDRPTGETICLVVVHAISLPLITSAAPA